MEKRISLFCEKCEADVIMLFEVNVYINKNNERLIRGITQVLCINCFKGFFNEMPPIEMLTKAIIDRAIESCND